MFEQARIKLTLSYLLILMFISVSFSFVIYKMLSDELERLIALQKIRYEMDFYNPDYYFYVPYLSDHYPDSTIIIESKKRIVTNLFFINSAIALASGCLSYFLAGRTLKPIKNMMLEQYRFTSDASHELRTPLTALKTNLEVNIRDKNLNLTSAKELINQSLSDVNQLENLTNSLLELSQIEITNHAKFYQTTNLQNAAEKALNTIVPIAKKSNITIESDLENALIKGNLETITRLITIFLDNAIKYSYAKSHVILKTYSKNNYAFIVVKDSGLGISKEDLAHVFDRFYRSDKVRTTSNKNGYGLGLSIAQKIVNEYNGKISITTKPEKGTEIIIKFPGFIKK